MRMASAKMIYDLVCEEKEREKMSVTIIVACDPDGVIGKDGKLPWRMPEDLKMFRERTLDHAIIMGRKTWESLPKKPLDRRANIVISRTMSEQTSDPILGPHWFGSIEEAIRAVRNSGEFEWVKSGNIYLIGGAQLYRTALDRDLVDKIILSRIEKKYDGDVHFPNIEGDSRWYKCNTDRKDGFEVLHFINRAKSCLKI